MRLSSRSALPVKVFFPSSISHWSDGHFPCLHLPLWTAVHPGIEGKAGSGVFTDWCPLPEEDRCLWHQWALLGCSSGIHQVAFEGKWQVQYKWPGSQPYSPTQTTLNSEQRARLPLLYCQPCFEQAQKMGWDEDSQGKLTHTLPSSVIGHLWPRARHCLSWPQYLSQHVKIWLGLNQ